VTAHRDIASKAKAWPFEEARKLLARLERVASAGVRDKGYLLFETGYGPSGLPHIGTFGEVARTSMVRRAFQELSDYPTKLLVFSDDMDGMRKIPDNVPDPAALQAYLHLPLTSVPNPFGGDFPSFGHHNNAMLRRFLDVFGFDYEFASATDYYKAGRFDAVLLRAAERFDDIMKVMLPTLGAERQATYSPFLPISPTTGRVLYVPMKHVDARAGTVTFDDEDGRETTVPVTGGHCKLQWKPDFGMRWAALDVDFEMFGKDHQTNAVVYDRICEILGGVPPQHYVYELFLDEIGQKISKSKGNGLSVDDWLTYAADESLALFMFQKPRTAKKLYFDAIPKVVDDYAALLDAYQRQTPAERLENPVWHIHAGNPPQEPWPVSFALLLNLVAASNPDSKEVMWGFIQAYHPGVSPQNNPSLDRLVGYALRYYLDFIKPNKHFREPNAQERAGLEALAAALDATTETQGEAIQALSFEIGKAYGFADKLRDWFKAFYEVVLGQEQGPRFGSFAALFGPKKTAALIREALSGAFLKAA
jgi:lysyl-tRNA synthetase class 1